MSKSQKITIQINKETFHFDKEVLEPNDFRSAVNLPAEYEVWQVVKAADPEGQLPKDDVQITQPIEIHNGQHYRVVPPGTFGGV